MDTTATPHPYFQTIVNAYAAAGRPFYHQLSPIEAREQLRTAIAAAPPPAAMPVMASVVDETITGPGGPLALRRYRPTGEVRGASLYFHAGGWVIGDLQTGDATCRRLAAAAGCEIVSVDYRLAPEAPYPAALDDAIAVLEWATTSGLGPIALIGESAGANLAAACAIRARDARGPAVVAQFLAYPVTDAAMDTASYRDMGERDWLLSTADMRWFWNHYCPPGTDRSDPLIAPLRVADAAGLPPTLIIVAELDPLRDEGLAYATRLDAAGVPSVTRCDSGMLHGYLSAAGVVPEAKAALCHAGDWLRGHFAAEQPR